MRQFLKFVLATIVGMFLFMLLSVILLIGLAISASSEDEVAIENNSVLELKLNKPIEERQTKDPFGGFGLPFGGMKNNLGLQEIKDAIRKAKTDNNIKGIYLNVSRAQAGMATLEEIRSELLSFKKSGKFIVAYNDICSEKSYYLTSVADKIYLNPAGTLEFNGLSTEVYFFKGMLEKLNIEPYIFKVGKFKSAVEPFFLDKMSEPSREQTTAFLHSLNQFSLQNIAKARKIPFEKLRAVSDSMLVHNAEDAFKYGLVTDLGYYDQALDYMKKKTGTKLDKELNLVTLAKYQKIAEPDEDVSRNRIAVIYASGDIVDGDGDEDNIGGDKFSEAIRKARLDDKIKAVVLRINSPGGSALASDVIWREVMLTKKVKPVIASMSDVAASGGYYIAMACDTIVAHPNTITGSIGVFGVMANFEGFLKDKLGVTVDRVKTGKFSDMPTVTRKLTDYEKQSIQQEVQRIYDDFTTKAAQGRRMPVTELQELAAGRVWSGIEAKERKLIDVYGGLDDAIKIAASQAKLKEGDYRVRRLPAQKSFFDELMKNMQGQTSAAWMRAELGEHYRHFETLKKVQTLQGIQARIPFEMEIQ
ncbi:signal peptide peptidase SppA [Adhaeribacter soli]|uniref:Signal peptide peptidase SppA n=1 Tax=Adhaeribacter soli TaxID=2607655 RepID=A0A5N1J6Y1_9BACT|nr:signal peptide peptidase SppA [Adhaeribacter soli]KAA9340560.1 signal peptide peptidase SppA [Adhaeribacter soli]